MSGRSPKTSTRVGFEPTTSGSRVWCSTLMLQKTPTYWKCGSIPWPYSSVGRASDARSWGRGFKIPLWSKFFVIISLQLVGFSPNLIEMFFSTITMQCPSQNSKFYRGVRTLLINVQWSMVNWPNHLIINWLFDKHMKWWWIDEMLYWSLQCLAGYYRINDGHLLDTKYK